MNDAVYFSAWHHNSSAEIGHRIPWPHAPVLISLPPHLHLQIPWQRASVLKFLNPPHPFSTSLVSHVHAQIACGLVVWFMRFGTSISPLDLWPFILGYCKVPLGHWSVRAEFFRRSVATLAKSCPSTLVRALWHIIFGPWGDWAAC